MLQASLLTNNRLTGLYKGLDHHYKDFITKNPRATKTQLHEELTNGMYYYLREVSKLDKVSFETLSENEKIKAYAVVKTYLSATPLFRNSDPYTFTWTAANAGMVRQEIHVYHHYNTLNDDLFFNFWWLQLDDTAAGSTGDSLAQLALFLILLLAVVLAAIALYYLVNQLLDSVEHFYYNEGILQATLSIFSEFISLAAASLLLQAYAMTPLINFALAAGVANPVGTAVFGVFCLSYIGGALGYWATNKLIQYVLAPSASQTLYTMDPYRYNLTAAEEPALLAKGIDPIKVKCAIIAIRENMGNEGTSAFWSRRTRADQTSIDSIRKLRCGEIYLINVADMQFDCRSDELIAKSPASSNVTPSAPPANEADDDDVLSCAQFA